MEQRNCLRFEMAARLFEYGLSRLNFELEIEGSRKCFFILSLDSLEHYIPVVRVLCFSGLVCVGVEKVNNKEARTGSGHKDPA